MHLQVYMQMVRVGRIRTRTQYGREPAAGSPPDGVDRLNVLFGTLGFDGDPGFAGEFETRDIDG